MIATINYWTRHYQSVWLERAADPSLADWMRLACLAFAKHRANGHANFAPGELGPLLAKAGPDGQLKPLTKSAVSNAIKRAKDRGWISKESTAQCLVVPPHAIAGGRGKPYEACRVHPYRSSHKRRTDLRSA